MNVAIVGALWTSNFGDVLLAKLLKDKLESLGHSVIMPNASKKVRVESGLLEEKFDLSEADTLVFCGGGYFSEPPGNSLKWALSRYKALFRYATYCKLKKIPYSIIGVGAGPVNSLLAKKIISHVVSGADSVLLRDKISVETVKSINSKANIIEVSDYVLSINDSYNLEKIENSKNKIGVHLTLNGNTQIPPILKYVNDNIESKDFYLIEDNPGEYQRLCDKYNDIKKLFGEKIITYKSVDQFICDMNQFDMIITSKLHVGIVAAALNKRICSLPYHAKVKRLYEEFGRSDVVLDSFDDPDGVYQHIENCSKSEIVIVPETMLSKSRKINAYIEQHFGG